MKHHPAAGATYQPWPRWWRIVLVAICTLILCSCQATRQPAVQSSCLPASPPALPQQAYTGMPEFVADPAAVGPGSMADEAGPSALPVGPWAPPGLPSRNWPRDEYLSDGGDAAPTAMVGEDWHIRGLNVEDTIGHFDTVDGRRIVTPSNQVSIYSPRFGAVRQVVGLAQNEQRDPWAGVHQPLKLVRHEERQIAATDKQNLQTETGIGRKLPITYRSEQGDGMISTMDELAVSRDASLARHTSSLGRHDILSEAEMAWLADGVAAADVWSHTGAVQVIIDRVRAIAETGDRKLDAVYTIKERPANPRLSVTKLASTALAAPGETVDFTIRFENVGDQVIGNVTIIDNLTTRLEYVPDTARCTVPAEFFHQPNEGQSLALRWEITDPLQPQQGGVITFRCRVR